MSQSAPNIGSLFAAAGDDGTLSSNSLQAFNIPDIGAQIQAALGTPADDVLASEVVLVTELDDDSGSISSAGNEKSVRDGHNLIIDSLMNSKQSDNILMHTRYLNGTILCPYTSLAQAPRMNGNNYNANGGTPLYDMSVITLGTVMAKALEFSNSGVPVRTVTLIMTDGADMHSYRSKPKDVKAIVDDMLRTEMHIVSAMGIDDGSTDFWQVFTGWTRTEIEAAKKNQSFNGLQAKGGMGIVPKWVLTPGNSPSEIRKAFQVFSQSAVRASQNAASFSQTALGGFGSNP